MVALHDLPGNTQPERQHCYLDKQAKVKVRTLSLFSGIGAHDLGLEWAGYKIVGQVEIDDYCQKILEKHWPTVPKWRDITRVTATDIRNRCGRIDLITGGFPCQDISTAGKQAGFNQGQRSSLWWEMWRLIKDLRPNWVLLENVPALRVKGGDNVLAALEAIGYTCWPLVVGAIHAGAPHERKRVWIVGYRKGKGKRTVAARSARQHLANANGTGGTLAGIIPDPDRKAGRTKQTMEGGSTVVATVSIEPQLESSSPVEYAKETRCQGGGVKRR